MYSGFSTFSSHISYASNISCNTSSCFILSFACIYASISPCSTLSDIFLFTIIPTALSISSSFFILPAPSFTDASPIFLASNFFTYPVLFAITGIMYFAFSNLLVSSMYFIFPP